MKILNFCVIMFSTTLFLFAAQLFVLASLGVKGELSVIVKLLLLILPFSYNFYLANTVFKD